MWKQCYWTLTVVMIVTGGAGMAYFSAAPPAHYTALGHQLSGEAPAAFGLAVAVAAVGVLMSIIGIGSLLLAAALRQTPLASSVD